MYRFKGFLAAAALAASATLAQAQTLSLEGGGAASLTGIVPQTYAQFAAEEGISLQVVLGQTLTRSALKLAAGRIDMAVVPPNAYGAMSRGVGPYKEQGDQAKKMAENVRALFAFPAGTFQAVVWADSGIEDWDDLAGKRVFIGPPAGAASDQIQTLIRLASGGLTVDNGDYEGIKAPWGAAQQSFQDGQFDVYIGSIAVGSQALNELSLQRDIRILGVSDEVRASQDWAEFLTEQAQFESVVPAGTYSGQSNGDQDLVTTASAMMMSVTAEMDDDTAYALTKAYWTNLDAMKNANALMRSIDASKPFAGMNAPLHPGALRYYQEAGIEIPADLMP
ncbi:TAXI family TRAP transporter solute-binding subunit [Antarctobacter jejuensis]|uniref:TAXI family TRAP transporter solute-binding subunit n=1 Tax=Antarctobacter jejuensis TaxID=1439938 RepID=UPI003FD55A09